MPELPEVETIRRGLLTYLLGKKVASIEVRLPRLFQGDTSSILNSRIGDVRRYGKGLVIDFANENSLAAHVKMTGQFIFNGDATQKNFHPHLTVTGNLPNKWTHVIFVLSTGETLFYNDIRQFGWLKVVKTQDIHELSFFKNLGPEPFGELTESLFLKIISSSASPIKNLLMNQQKIGGVGNIYANEALFEASIRPTRKASDLTKKEGKKLYSSLLHVLQKGLEYGGASDVNYIRVDGTKGEFQHHFLVYRKGGQLCPRCSSKIVRIVQAGRSSFFCPHCQK